jgi:hypothetical protein
MESTRIQLFIILMVFSNIIYAYNDRKLSNPPIIVSYAEYESATVIIIKKDDRAIYIEHSLFGVDIFEWTIFKMKKLFSMIKYFYLELF